MYVHVNLICATPHLPKAASGLALCLICMLLWMAVKALAVLRQQFPLHQIGLPQYKGEAT